MGLDQNLLENKRFLLVTKLNRLQLTAREKEKTFINRVSNGELRNRLERGKQNACRGARETPAPETTK
jgi:hypothetical protein